MAAAVNSDFSTFESLTHLDPRPLFHTQSSLPPTHPQPSSAEDTYNATLPEANQYSPPHSISYPYSNSLPSHTSSPDIRQTLYDKIQLPLLISVVYFLIQLPFLDYILNVFGLSPYCFKENGTPTTEGHIIKSIIMGGGVYAVHMALISI